MDSITRAHPPEIGPLTNDHWIECRRQCRTASRSPVGVSREVPGCGRAAVDLAAGLAVAGVESGGIDSSGVDSGGVDSNTDGFFVGQDDWVERQYLADDLDLAADPRVSPMHADSHADLAPAIIGIGHHDPLLDQDLAYAKVLAAAGVPTVLRKYPDLIHGFFGMGGVSASAERAASQLCRDLRTLLTNTTTGVRTARS